MKPPRKQFAALIGAPVKVDAATQIAWNWFRVGVKHGSGKRIPKTDYDYLKSMMGSARVSWKRLGKDWLKKLEKQ